MPFEHLTKIGVAKGQVAIDKCQAQHGRRWLHCMLREAAQQDQFVILPLFKPDTPWDALRVAQHYFELHDLVNIPSDREIEPDAGELDSHASRLLLALPAAILALSLGRPIISFVQHIQAGGVLVTDCHSLEQATAVAALATHDAPHLPLLVDVGEDWVLWEKVIYAGSLSAKTALVVRAADFLSHDGGADDKGRLLRAQEVGLVLCRDSGEARRFIEIAGRDARLFALPVAITDGGEGETILPRAIMVPEKFAIHDEFMRPLEPLADNLVAGLYFAMEMDDSKYEAYRGAIRDAIHSLPSDHHSSPLSIMIVGAGRGPLVEAVLQVVEGRADPAADRIVVVEKNANAFATLYSKHRAIWPHRYPRSAGSVELHLAAIGELQLDGEFRAQLLVSELLGSFGDNELAPECMSQAHRFLAPGGLVIPTSSTSYLLPVCYPRSRRILAKASPSQAETPSVVYTTGIVPLGAGAAVFHYDYTDPRDYALLDRTARLQFTLSNSGRLDGFMGYFEAHLFGEHRLSISPLMAVPSAGRESWFPLFFPVAQQPSSSSSSSSAAAAAAAEAPVIMQMDRVTEDHDRDRGSVWYEWRLDSDSKEAESPHNAGGRHYRIQWARTPKDH